MNLIDQLKRDEGCKLEVYLDTQGIRTAGYGHNCEAHKDWLPLGHPITQEQADLWLLGDVANASRQVDEHFPWVKDLDTARHDVLVNMMFNMGPGKLLQFHRMLTYAEDGNYQRAADEMLNSTWAEQVGDRAKRLAEQMRTGEYA